MANQHFLSPVPVAGLKLLQGHSGGFDALDRDFPHQTLARLEEAVQAEEREEKEIFTRGQAQFNALWALAGGALASPQEGIMKPTGKLTGGDLALTMTAGKIIVDQKQELVFDPVRPFDERLYQMTQDDKVAFILFGETDNRGLVFADFADATGLAWLVWEDQKPSSEVKSDV